MSSLNLQMLVIDPQRDFTDPNGRLYVPGANKDMANLARLVTRIAPKINKIHVTMDSHQEVDISHQLWWKDSSGNHPAPFTCISAEDVRNGRWTTSEPSFYRRSLAYLEALQAGGRYPHVIWPDHCIIGTEGHAINAEFQGALHEWVIGKFPRMVNYVTKGSNPWTEHFSGVQAEVPDPSDSTTQPNTKLVSTIEEGDIILLAGEALSHCLANTGRDIARMFDPKSIKKLHLLTDACSNVTGFDQYGEDFVRDMVKMGMNLTTCDTFLA